MSQTNAVHHHQPSNSSQTPTGDKAVINELFATMKVAYPSFLSNQDEIPAKRLWHSQIGTYSRERIQEAMRLMFDAHPTFAPTVGEFKKLCKGQAQIPAHRDVAMRLAGPAEQELDPDAAADLRAAMADPNKTLMDLQPAVEELRRHAELVEEVVAKVMPTYGKPIEEVMLQKEKWANELKNYRPKKLRRGMDMALSQGISPDLGDFMDIVAFGGPPRYGNDSPLCPTCRSLRISQRHVDICGGRS